MSRDTSGREQHMKFIVMVAQEATDGTIGSSMKAYDSYVDAQSAYHMELAYGLVSEKLSADTCAIIGTDGQVYAITRVECKGASSATGRAGA